MAFDSKKTKFVPYNDIEETKNLFPDIYEIAGLTEDSFLERVKILNSFESSNYSALTVSIHIPATKKADLFLLINNKVHDSFFQIASGTYTFNNFFLQKGKFLFEVFYRLGTRKSKSVSFTIQIGGKS